MIEIRNARFTAIILIVIFGFGCVSGGLIVTPTDQLTVGDTAFYLKVYNGINNYRSKHVSPSLRWNRTQNEQAESLAVQFARACSLQIQLEHDDLEGVNFWGSSGPRPSASFVVNGWYNESSLYNYNTPGYDPVYLNFTQMVWKSSGGLGVGAATFNGYSVVVAKFSPRGNVPGKFRSNVVPPRL